VKKVNANLKNIFKWFLDSERCVMHKNTIEMPIVQVNLSNTQLDELLKKGQEIIQQRAHAKPIEQCAFRYKDSSNS